jgi:hypothetical protein
VSKPARAHPADVLRAAAERAEDHIVDALAAAVIGALAAKPSLGLLREAAVLRDDSMNVGGHNRLAAALGALDLRGVIRLPGAKHWDCGRRPALPLWVHRVAERRPVRQAVVVPDDVVAALPPHAMAALAGLRPGASDVAVLARVAAWLRNGGAERPVVPSRERSVQVFGDEKRLDRLAGGRLFTAGVLSLDLLRAETVPVPLTATWVPGHLPGEPLCLVVENHHTWVSLRRAARASAGRHAGIHVGWGAGEQFRQGVAGVRLLEPPATEVAYFGDLDPKGLETPTEAAGKARAAGLPPVLPALGLYHLLIRVGVGQRTGAGLVAADARAKATWLGPLAGPAMEYLQAGVRLPQEYVGSEALAGTTPAEWLSVSASARRG